MEMTIDGKWRRGRRCFFFVPDCSACALFSVLSRGGRVSRRRRGRPPAPSRTAASARAQIFEFRFFNLAIFSWTNCALFAPPPAGAAGGEENKRGELPFFFVSRLERKPSLTNRQSYA